MKSFKYTPIESVMRVAITQAKTLKLFGEYPIGAAVVNQEGSILGLGFNMTRINNDATAHAEVIAIRAASNLIGSRQLQGCVLYTTHEPCPMCSAAACLSRMSGVVYSLSRDDMKQHRELDDREDTHLKWRTFSNPAGDILKGSEPELFIVGGFLKEKQ